VSKPGLSVEITVERGSITLFWGGMSIPLDLSDTGAVELANLLEATITSFLMASKEVSPCLKRYAA
jgi:hypothetical protein